MIPRVAHFYWGGGPMPWLRRQALETFRKLHPSWHIVLGTPDGLVDAPLWVQIEQDTVSPAHFPVAVRSDIWRWYALSTRGGLYADTDVIFVRNVEEMFAGDHDAWLTTDLGTPVEYDGMYISPETGRAAWKTSVSIGVLAARERSELFGHLLHVSLENRVGGGQSHGSELLAKYWRMATRGLSVGKIPAAAFYDRGSADFEVRGIWDGSRAQLLPEMFGLHWYGGSTESRPFERAQALRDLPARSLVRAALRRTC